MEVKDFLPTYIDYTDSILGPELIDTTSLFYKKEFNDYKLEKVESRPDCQGKYMNHQIYMSRFLSSYTPYKGILVMHEPGTGKTCLSVAVVEKIISEKSLYKGAIILMKGKNLITNYIKELVNTCTDGKYDIEDDEMTDNKKKRRITKKISHYYKFKTFETFSKLLSTMSEEEIRLKYSNYIIIIDEAHHLRLTSDKELESQYNNIYRFVHSVENSKTVLMTGTPMIDNPSEIASLMNLILDKNEQLPTGDQFISEYMKKVNTTYLINKDKSDELKSKLYGKVSFLRSMQSTVKREYVGETLDLKFFNQYVLPMEDVQLSSYKKSLQEDSDTQGIYINSREASLFTFPDGSYGKKGFEKYVTIKKDNVSGKMKLNCTFFDTLFKDKTIDEKLEILRKYSIKYASCIQLLLKNEGNHFVYMDFVQGSGAIIFSELLKQFGFSDYKSGGQYKYALLTSKTSGDIDKAISVFNSEKNINGSLIKVIIGTKIISEGFTLKNVRHVHILTPHWNFSETDQAIARAFRLFSHSDKLIDLVVKIYLYTTLTKDDTLSIDRYMYKFCEDKDIAIKSIEHLLKMVSFDCLLAKERNVLDSSLDYTRNCEYQKCLYTCYNQSKHEIDYSTYNMFYDQPEIDRVMIQLKQLFSKQSVYNVQELQKLIDIPFHVLIKTILYCIDHKVVFGNSFLYYHQDTIYLSPKLCDNDTYDSFYVDHIPLQLEFHFNETVDRLYSEYLPILFTKLKEEKNKDKKKLLLSKFDDRSKELLLEISILSKEAGYTVDPIREYIINHFSNVVSTENDIITSTLLGKKKYRCLEKGATEWKDCSTDVKKSKKSEYGYEGFYENDIFKIREIQTDLPVDGRKATKGINCVLSIKKPKLLEIIHHLKIPYEGEHNMSIDDIQKAYEQIEKTLTMPKVLSYDEMVSIIYWNEKQKKEICKRIELFFA